MQLSGQTLVRLRRGPVLGPRLVMAEYEPRTCGAPVLTVRITAAGAYLPWPQSGLVQETSATSFRPLQALTKGPAEAVAGPRRHGSSSMTHSGGLCQDESSLALRRASPIGSAMRMRVDDLLQQRGYSPEISSTRS